MELESAVGILGSKIQITKPSKVTVKVTSNTPFHRVNPNNGGTVVAIVNFNAMNGHQAQEARRLLGEGDYQAAVNQGLSWNVREGYYNPSKGDIVNIHVGYVKTKEGEDALLVTSVEEVKVDNSFTKGDFSDFLEGAETVSEASEAEAGDDA